MSVLGFKAPAIAKELSSSRPMVEAVALSDHPGGYPDAAREVPYLGEGSHRKTLWRRR